MASKLKVLQIASGDLWAGAEVQLFNLCTELVRRDDIELFVILFNEGELTERLRLNGVEVCVFSESEMSFFSLTREILQYCKAIQPDLIHSHRTKENIIAGVCRVVRGVPSLRTVHGASEFTFDKWSPQYFIELANRFTGRVLQKKVIAVSHDLKAKLEREYSEKCLKVIVNGVNFDEIDNAYPADLEGASYNIGIVGRLVPVKRVDLFIEAASQLLAQHQSNILLKFYIIGDGPLMETLQAQVKGLGLTDQIVFVGHVPSALPYLKSLDLLLMCSDHEGTPMTLLETMRVGLPIVAHDVGGLRELLADGRCGKLVSDHSAKGYSIALNELIADKEKREFFKVNALRRVSDYSSSKAAEAHVKLYKEILGF